VKSNHTIPPQQAQRFLRWFLRNDLAEEVHGDLEEQFYVIQEENSTFKAKLNYYYQVFNYLRPFAIRKSNLFYLNQAAMFQSYFKIGWRNLVKQKMYSSIKIGGFALGIATCLLITLFIRQELSYDQYYANKDRIFRVYNDYTKGESDKWTSFPAPIAQILTDDFPEVEKAGRLIPYSSWFKAGSNLFRREDQADNIYEEGFAYADQALLEILQIPMVYGSQEHVLAEPNTIVISKRKADKFFPDEDPVGKTVILDDDESQPYTVGGVMENFPANSHLQFDFLITLTEVEFWEGEQTSWCCWNYNAYIQLRQDADPRQLEKKLSAIKDLYYVSYLEKTGDQEAGDVKKYHSFKLQPVSDIYLMSATDGIESVGEQGDIKYVWLFGAIACFILLLACINFINLSTAKSANRAKEVGLRKVVGSVRSHLVVQFLTESFIFSLISFVLALLIVWFALPFFNILADKSLTIPWTAWWFLPLLLLAVVIMGILAGMYPSFYLSAFKPIDVLKGKISRGSKGSRMRSTLVIFQFTASIVLIIGTIIIYRQMNFILNTKIGFDKEQVITIEGANTMGDKQITFKNELLRLSDVQHVTISNYLPVEGTKRDQNQFWRDGKSKVEKSIGAQKWFVDTDYIHTMGINLIDGRNFMPEMASDSQAVIINQTMAKEFGFEYPVGERIMRRGQTYTIIGMVEDFHFESLKGKIGALCFVLGNGGSIVSVKVKTDDMAGTLQSVTNVWNEFMPHQAMRYTFLDESYARMYEDVQRMGQIFSIFTMLAIIVACLGLFALSAFMVEQRTKEISIRLVLGASLKNILRLLTQNYLTLIFISLIIAIPIAWYMMQEWLADYEYRIQIGWDVFLLAGLLAVLITLFTISYQSIRAALMNPVDNLRAE
jgi:putative ABC transport system permease protein